MNLIKKPKTLAERIVNAVCRDIYGRSGGDHWFDGIDEDVMQDELIPELVAAVERELSRPETTERP
jgi:hypothetical protein